MIDVRWEREKSTSAVHSPTGGPSLTRRRLLSSTGQIAFLATLPTACMPVINAPWSDGTLWTDGQGWTD